MPARSILLVLTAALVSTGCYHQVVRTGATPSNVVVDRPWTATYLFGLIPATTINTATQCPAGVAIIETRQSFMNGLVGGLTLGIYTPQTVTITCAEGGTAMIGLQQFPVPADASPEDRMVAVREAVSLAQRTGEPVALFSLRGAEASATSFDAPTSIEEVR